MPGRELPPLVADLLYAQEHRLLNDDVGLAVHRVLTLGIDDAFSRTHLDRRIHDHVVAQALRGPFRHPELENGDVVLGRSEQGAVLAIPLQFLNAHALTVGGSGSGKTTSSRFRILQVAPRVAGTWLFDFRKREYAPLRDPLRRVGVELSVVPARRLRLNPLQLPASVQPADWSSRVADALVQVLELPQRATKLLHVVILQLYQRFNVQTDKDACPTLFDLREALAGANDANAQARMAVIDSLDPLLLSLGPKVLAYRRAWPTSELARRHIVFEFDGVAEADKDLVLNSLLLSEFTSRVACGVSNRSMNLSIWCDEALRLVAASESRSSMADLLGLIRGTGIGLDLSVQTSDVQSSILSNTSTKFIGRCGNAADYDKLASAMGLNGEQRRWLNLKLEPGMFVCQLGEGSWRHPFVVRVPHVRLPSGQLVGQEGLPDLDKLPTVPAAEFERWTPDGTPVEIRVHGPVHDQSQPLDVHETRFLRTVVDQPGQRACSYAKSAQVSARRAMQIRRRLVELGLLQEHAVMSNTRGRPSIILEPTREAFELLKKLGGE
jgi:hypothetical protein